MPISVELWSDLRDSIVERVHHGIRLKSTIFSDPRIVLLRYVDPYGETVFNPVQCATLLAEIRLLLDKEPDPDWLKVEEFARTCRDSPHTFLVFDGD
jgi:hypothetical protein